MLSYILDYNDKFKTLFGCFGDIEPEKSFIALLDEMKRNIVEMDNQDAFIKMIESNHCTNHYSGQMSIQIGDNVNKSRELFFLVNIQPVHFNKRTIVGKVISFTDITEYRMLVEELASAQERNRLARDLHDTIGHTLTILLTLLNVGSLQCSENPQAAKQKMVDAIGIAQTGLGDIRAFLNKYKQEVMPHSKRLMQVIDSFMNTGIEIDHTICEFETLLDSKASDAVYRLCQEALTNAARHGKASHVDIVINHNESCVKILVCDNGTGCEEIKKGTGLLGMEQRMKESSGIVSYGSGTNEGFSVYAEIPIMKEGIG